MNIINYNPRYAADFEQLNLEWLETYFYVEPYDKEVLSKPETYILDKGGHIFFAVEDEAVLGTVALMPIGEKGVLELTKMAVLPATRGKGIGQKLVKYCLAFAKAEHLNKLILYSNTRLENAIYIYRKLGFIEIPVEANSKYIRSDIKMEYIVEGLRI